MTGSLEGGSDQFSRSVMSDSLRPHGLQPSNRLILCRALLLLPPIPPSIRVFSNESALRIRWPEYWSFSFSISPSNEHPGLVSFGTDWLDLLAVQGTLKSLLLQKICIWMLNNYISKMENYLKKKESSSTPQFKSINSLVLSFIYSPTFTSIQYHWKNYSLD